MARSLRKSLIIIALAGFHTAVADFPDLRDGATQEQHEEMVQMMIPLSSVIPRLGLPTYIWWNEALHGLAISPGADFADFPEPFSSATSFPQPILTSAAFDDGLVHAIATVISTEARAFNNANRSGLNYWTPNINPFRDPRWGRGQETPGEDPYRISQYVYNLVNGLQGGAEKNQSYKVVATCKHFAGYDLESWHGTDRMGFDAAINTQDLAEFYTPGFQSCIRDAHAGSVMCSYNAIHGVPSCADPFLLQTLLREHYEFGDGWVTGDCLAVQDICVPHDYTDLLVNASAVSLKAGTDMDCGVTFNATLLDAVDQKLVTVGDIKTALVRRYTSLVRAGYFDPASTQPYRQLGWDDVNTPSAQALALTAASEGIVLLKNDGVLPLPPSVKKVALIGPWQNTTTAMQGSYRGIAPFLVSPLDAFVTAGFDVTALDGTNIQGLGPTDYLDALGAAQAADVVVYAGGIDNSVEEEFLDRDDITWPGLQLELIEQLAKAGKPVVVVQFGGGQVDDSALKANDKVNALLWVGYPGQSGGTAIVDVLTGKTPPAGRLPITQYPADYVNEIPMTYMSLRPHALSPGRTYKWYTGTPVYDFGFGMHYTTFDLSWSSTPPSSFSIAGLLTTAKTSDVAFVDLASLFTFQVNVTNTGTIASDYVTLLFSNTTAGPAPAPLKQLVSCTRLKNIAPGGMQTAELSVMLGSMARVDEDGNSALYPGTYNIWVDINREIVHTFELTGDAAQISAWTQPN